MKIELKYDLKTKINYKYNIKLMKTKRFQKFNNEF